ARQVWEAGQIAVEDVTVEKEQCAQRLIVGRRRHLALDREEAEKLRDFWRPHLGGMALAVKQDVPADPSDVGLLGAAAAVAQPIGLAHAIQQSWRTHAPVD